MFEKYSGLKILKKFAEEPYREFYLREISKICRVSTSTAKRYLDLFAKKNFITKTKRANLALFKSNLDNYVFKQFKIYTDLGGLENSGLINYLESYLKPRSITLFGSTARGESSKKSDIDLLAISNIKKEIDLSQYEETIGKKINLLVYDLKRWQEKAKKDKAFYERILTDGIALYGEVPAI